MAADHFQAMSLSEIRDYLLLARALISQGAVDVDTPSEKMAQWARWAVRSTDGVLTEAVAKLAEGTASRAVSDTSRCS